MGEYIKYKNAEIKIGTCEDLYYTSYQKYVKALDANLLSRIYPRSIAPSGYAQPDSGFRFRFPFPDEDHLPMGQIKEPYNRGIPVRVDPKIDDFLVENFKAEPGKDLLIEITQQKLVHREKDGRLTLAVVVRDPIAQQSFRIEDDAFIAKLSREIIRNHVLNEPHQDKRDFYRALASRILKGYRLESPSKRTSQKAGKKLPPPPKRGRRL